MAKNNARTNGHLKTAEGDWIDIYSQPRYLRFASCRDIGHSWAYTPHLHWRSGERVLQCTVCKTVRRDGMTDFGVESRRYVYPAHYLIKNVVDLDIALEIRRRLGRLLQSSNIRVVHAVAADLLQGRRVG